VSAARDTCDIDGEPGFLYSGEFHYFRVPRPNWRDRLRRCRDIGLNAVSIYIPWNWHQTNPDAKPDFGGEDVPERDLYAAIEEIDAAGLDCIYRPGPFITAEWRDGGLPAWLWERSPELLALDAGGGVSLPGHPYPGLTSSHPAYRDAEAVWLEAALDVARDHLATRGGCIVEIQLDDEPSYWQRLAAGPLVADYNPFLIAGKGNVPSRFATWVLQRHGSLDAVNQMWGTKWDRPEDIEPPREAMSHVTELPRFADWFDFKLAEVNDDSAFQYRVVTDAGGDVPISMLFPYLLPLDATRYADFIEEKGLPIHLTNECYLSLFGPNSCPEQKVGDIVATHETYHMWRRGHGPAVTMELQGSNSTYITPGAMELLYAVTVARGIKGVNFYMMIGGVNPDGFENVTGRGYDISAPIAIDGSERPHASVIRKLARIVEAGGSALLEARPLRDTWVGCYVPYERAALVGGGGPFKDVADLLGTVWNGGDMGLSDAASLPSLMTLSSVSFGCIDLERASAEELAALPQLWMPGLPFLAADVQERLVRYVRDGGHLLLVPGCPRLDERGEPATALWDVVMQGVGLLEADPRESAEAMHMLRTPWDESIVAPGPITVFDLPADTKPLVTDVPDGRPCAFTRIVGSGRVSLLGFNFQYIPNEQDDQFTFLERLVSDHGRRPLSTTCSNRRCVAMQMNGEGGGFLCIVNPVDLPAATTVRYTGPGDEGTDRRASFPHLADAIPFDARGARLLPVGLRIHDDLRLRHATWELTGVRHGPEQTELEFATVMDEVGELAIDGAVAPTVVGGGEEIDRREGDGVALAVRASGDRCTIAVRVEPADASST
jgi:beta-galactosidase